MFGSRKLTVRSNHSVEETLGRLKPYVWTWTNPDRDAPLAGVLEPGKIILKRSLHNRRFWDNYSGGITMFRGAIEPSDHGSVIKGRFVVNRVHLCMAGLVGAATMPAVFHGEMWALLLPIALFGLLYMMPVISGDPDLIRKHLKRIAR
jgi:hypothetical protein